MIYVAAGVVLGVLVLLVTRFAGRGASPPATGEGPRPWTGPRRFNPRPSVRLPRAIPRPVERIERNLP